MYGIRLPSGGNAAIYLDGVKAATRSFYASSATRAKVYETPPLSAGTHTIAVLPLGTRPSASSGTWVAIDNMVVGATARQESALRQAFAKINAAGASGGSYDQVTHMTDSDNSPAFFARFVGTGVKLYATRTAASGGLGSTSTVS